MNACNEFFLDELIRLELYSISESISVPSTLPNIVSLDIKEDPVLDISFISSPISIKEGTLTVKQSHRKFGSNLLYTYNIEAIIETGILKLEEMCYKISRNDYYVVLTKQDNSRLLLFTLTNTFNVNIQDSLGTGTLKISLSSLNNYISIE